MTNPAIAVFGATGAQGGSVVRYLKKHSGFRVRALTRDPSKYDGPADEAVAADLDNVNTLEKALQGAHGVFVVTNFWQEGTDEIAQARAAISAGLKTGINHFIWSSLPEVEDISNGKWKVPHFTNKARIDPNVRSAGFPMFTIVQPPFYFENLIGNMAPTDLEGGTRGWALPIDPGKRVIHMGAIEELGSLVTGAFTRPELSNGKTLSMAAGLYSFKDVVDIFNAELAAEHIAEQVPHDVFSSFFPGAAEIGQMLGYFQDFTYMGPESEYRIALAKEVALEPFTSLSRWLSKKLSN